MGFVFGERAANRPLDPDVLALLGEELLQTLQASAPLDPPNQAGVEGVRPPVAVVSSGSAHGTVAEEDGVVAEDLDCASLFVLGKEGADVLDLLKVPLVM